MAFHLKALRSRLWTAAALASMFGIMGCGTPQYEPLQPPNPQYQPPAPAQAPQVRTPKTQNTHPQTLPPQTPQFQAVLPAAEQSSSGAQIKLPPPEPIRLKEGDVIRIVFPGAPNLNTLQQVRRDGRVSLPLGVGEVVAAGLTPSQLEQQLVGLYASQLVSKEVTVTVESSSFPVFVTGAVLRPGRILSDRPITALEAIMEAGGFDLTRAKLKSVVVFRNVEGRMQRYTLNLERVLQGRDNATFNLKPSDIIYVPEKFSWF